MLVLRKNISPGNVNLPHIFSIRPLPWDVHPFNAMPCMAPHEFLPEAYDCPF